MKPGKKNFYFTSEAPLYSRKSYFRILYIQVSSRHQMPLSIKPEIHFTKYSNLESKHSLLMKFGQFMSYYLRNNFIKKFHKNYDLETSSRTFYVYKELSTTSIGK